MKKSAFYIPVILIAAILFFSCKKDSDDSPTLSGQWNVNKDSVIHGGAGGTLEVVNYGSGSYANFASDGNVYYKFIEGGIPYYDTAAYIINGNTIIFNWFNAGGYSDTLHIQELTNNSAILSGTLYNPFGSNELFWEYLSR